MSICGSGMETISFPFLPSISPCVMYLRRFCLILPRTISRKRRWSWSILRLMSAARSSIRASSDRRVRSLLALHEDDVLAVRAQSIEVTREPFAQAAASAPAQLEPADAHLVDHRDRKRPRPVLVQRKHSLALVVEAAQARLRIGDRHVAHVTGA